MRTCKHQIEILTTGEAKSLCEWNNNEMKKLIKDGVISQGSLTNYPLTFDENFQICRRCNKCGRWWFEPRANMI